MRLGHGLLVDSVLAPFPSELAKLLSANCQTVVVTANDVPQCQDASRHS